MNRVCSQIKPSSDATSAEAVTTNMSSGMNKLYFLVKNCLGHVVNTSLAADRLDISSSLYLSCVTPWMKGQTLQEMKADQRSEAVKQVLVSIRIKQKGVNSKVIELALSSSLKYEHPSGTEAVELLKSARALRKQCASFAFKLMIKAWERQVFNHLFFFILHVTTYMIRIL